MPEANSQAKGLIPPRKMSNVAKSNTTAPIDFNSFQGESPAIVYGVNSPSNNTQEWFVLTQVEGDTSTKYQMAFSFNAFVKYERLLIGNSWSTWKSVIFT